MLRIKRPKLTAITCKVDSPTDDYPVTLVERLKRPGKLRNIWVKMEPGYVGPKGDNRRKIKARAFGDYAYHRRLDTKGFLFGWQITYVPAGLAMLKVHADDWSAFDLTYEEDVRVRALLLYCKLQIPWDRKSYVVDPTDLPATEKPETIAWVTVARNMIKNYWENDWKCLLEYEYGRMKFLRKRSGRYIRP